jgi:hypothetical protein
MTIIIKKGTTKEEVEKLLLKLNKTKKKIGLRKYFGKPIANTKGLDPVAYQKMLRNEWD